MQEVADTLIPLFLADTGIYHFKHPVTGKKVSSRARSVRGAYAAYNELCWELMGERPVNMQSEELRQTGWVDLMWSRTKQRARTRRIPFTITRDYIRMLAEQAAGRCMLTGISFTTFNETDFSRSPWTASLDRIDSKKGYEPGNCRIVCTAVNTALNEWGEPVLLQIAEALLARKSAACAKTQTEQDA